MDTGSREKEKASGRQPGAESGPEEHKTLGKGLIWEAAPRLRRSSYENWCNAEKAKRIGDFSAVEKKKGLKERKNPFTSLWEKRRILASRLV